jgi:hypothetical protein
MLMPTTSATSRTLKRRFPRITTRTHATFLTSVDIECRPGLWSSPNDFLPSL